MASTEGDELADDWHKLNLNSTSTAPVRNNHRARDITREFTAASKALEIGQLVRDDGFSLFDSVQALEIMDPKMDTGFLEPGETLDDYYDVCQELLPAEVVWIMDQLLCYEMAWHQGYPLAQNLLTSVYIYNLLVQDRLPNATPFFRPLDGSSKEPAPLMQKVLRAFCIGIIKTCDVVIEIVQTQQYYEEEDFNTHTFGLNLLTDVSDDEFFYLYADAMQWLNGPEGRELISTDMVSALLSRLTCRDHLLTLILPNRASDQKEIIGSYAFQSLVLSFDSEKPGICRESTLGAFSSKLQRRLASTVPPRPIINLDIRTASENLCKMYTDIQEALKVDQFGTSINIDNLITFLWCFSAREPCAFARAVLQMLLFSEGKAAGPGDGMQSLLINEIRWLLVEPACLQENFWDVEHPSDPRYQIARAVDFFLEQAAPEFINILRSLCQNRCRIRRCLTNVIKDFDSLQSDLLKYFGEDTFAQSGKNFASLVKHGLLLFVNMLLTQAIDWAIELGFEQGIYEASEFAGLQYYLARIGLEKDKSCELFNNQTNACSAEIERITRRPFVSDAPMETGSDAIWYGLCSLYAALARLDAIPPPKTPYANLQSQFELRMRPFSSLKHGVAISFTMYEYALTQPTTPLADLLVMAATKLLVARNAASARIKAKPARSRGGEDLEAAVTRDSAAYETEHHTAMLKACVRAAVGVETLRRALKDAGGDEAALKGRVVATMEAPALARYWLVPSIVVVPAAGTAAAASAAATASG